jgi:hypothetical protein
MKKVIILALLAFASLSGNAMTAGLTGSTNVNEGETIIYSYVSIGIIAPVWIISPATRGTVVSSGKTGSTYYANIQWIQAGTATVTLSNDGDVDLASLSVTINSTAPVTTFSLINNCGSTLITRNSAPPSGREWYWQTSPTGTSTALGIGSTISQSSSGAQYYLRTRLTASGAWGGLLAVGNVTVYSMPSAPVTANHASGFRNASVTLSVGSVSGATGYKWYLTGAGETAISGATTNSYVVNSLLSTTTYYVSSIAGPCENLTRLPVMASVEPSPQVHAIGNRALTMGNPVTLGVNGTYASYSWRNSSGAIIGTQATIMLTLPGEYTAVVTKTGVSGNGTSLPYTVALGPSGQNLNYIVSNTIQQDGVMDINVVTNLLAESNNQTIQYFDGLGRPMQTVTTQGSPGKKDIVQPIVYDAYGREYKKYLPFTAQSDGWYKPTDQIIDPASGSYTGIAQPFYANGSNNNIADDTHPFAETIFEASPLSRPLKNYGPGSDWAAANTNNPGGKNKYIEHQYLSNIHGTTTSVTAEKVIAWKINGAGVPVREAVFAGNIETGGYYSTGQLNVKVTVDEHLNAVREYTNKKGQVILKKVQAISPSTDLNNTAQWAMTYYLYDDFGNLRYVFPPELSKLVHNNADTYSVTATDLTNWAFQYKYDARKRMIEKRVPGADWVYMVYDDRDRLVLTQDGNQRSAKYWTFTKYDVFNRPVATGIKDTAIVLTQVQMQSAVNAHYAKAWAKYGETYIGSSTGNIHAYTNKSYPVVTGPTTTIDPNRYLTITYYDNYDFRSQWSGAYEYYNDALSQIANDVTYSQPAAASTFVIGQVTGTKVKVLDGGVTGGYTWLKSVNYYDDKYRLIQVQSDNYKGGTDRISNLYDFPGKILKSKETHVEYDPAWQNMGNVIRSGNKLIATTSTWGNAGAASIQTLAAGQNGWVECLTSETTTGRIFGLSDTNPDLGYASIRYGFQQSPSGLYVIESGAQTLLSTTFNPGEILTIERVGSVINYKRNGSTVKSTSGALTTPLFIDIAMNNIDGTLVGLRSSFSTSSKSIVRTFTYDHAGRLTEIWHQVDSGPVILLSKNEYNELGQLVDKKLHSTVAAATDAKQSVDYRYNIRGWLTSMNNSQLSNDGTTNDDTGDYFGMNLGYNADMGISNSAMFNGNISGIKWSNNLGTGTIKEKAYTYSYDAMNRIAGSTFKENTTAWTALGNSGFAESGFTYDLNGNILSLTRNDKRSGDAMDILQYDYGTGTCQSNKLRYVMDNGDDHTGFKDGNPGTTSDYDYDANGNMFVDNNKGLDLITYNYLNLPENVTKNGNTLHYIYDASGRKLMQEIISGSKTKQTEYAGAFTYEDDVLQFISHEEGRVVMTEGPKLLYTNAGDNVTGITPNGATTALTTLNGGQTYIEVSHGGAAQRSGIYPINGILTVQAGERYLIRAKGYRTGNTAVNFQVRINSVDQGVGVALPFGAAAECYVEQLVTIPVGGTELRMGLIWIPLASGEKFYVNDVEIYRLGISSTPEYQYNLKDHLGNVRLTFTTKNETETSLATLETANATSEQGKFLYYNEAIKVNHPPFDHTNAGTTYYSTRLTGGSTNAKYGLTKTLSIMPGDVVNMEVYAKYLDPTSTNWTAALNNFITAINGGTAPAGTIVDGGAAGSIGGGTYPISPINHAAETGTPPKAYLNYIVFDRTMTIVLDVGYSRITANSREYGQDGAHDHLILNYTAKEPGYIYIYLSNENPTVVEVYFDDFKVEHVKSPVVQADDYYPFGLTFNAYHRENSILNRSKFQGQEHIDELNLGWDSFKWRNCIPDIGRFFNVDPLAPKYVNNSPYAFSENHVTSHVELEGLEKVSIHVRHFIPEARAGRGFFRGDNRGFTTSSSVTSRVSHTVTVDTKSKEFSTSTVSSPTKFYPAGTLSDIGIEKTATPEAKGLISSDNKSINVSSEYSAADPLALGTAPDIDFKNNFSIIPNYENGSLIVMGATTGDQYPAAESFVTDEAGNSVFVGVAPAEGNIGDSYGLGDKILISNTVKIATDSQGNFTGVYGSDGKVIPIEDYNKQYQSTKPN